MRVQVISWDKDEKPDLDGIAAAAGELSDGSVVIREVDVPGDFRVWVVSDRELTDDELQTVLDHSA